MSNEPMSDDWIDILFDGPPGHDAPGFVEVERCGKGFRLGEWIELKNGLWAIRFNPAELRVEEIRRLLEENEENKQHALRLFRELEPLHRKHNRARELLESVDTVNPEELVNKIVDFLDGK